MPADHRDEHRGARPAVPRAEQRGDEPDEGEHGARGAGGDELRRAQDHHRGAGDAQRDDELVAGGDLAAHLLALDLGHVLEDLEVRLGRVRREPAGGDADPGQDVADEGGDEEGRGGDGGEAPPDEVAQRAEGDHRRPDGRGRADEEVVAGDGHRAEDTDDGGSRAGIQQALAPQRGVGHGRKTGDPGIHDRRERERDGGGGLLADVTEDGGGADEEQGAHAGERGDEDAAVASGEQRVGRGEEEHDRRADGGARAVGRGPRGELGLDEVGHGLDDVVVDLVAVGSVGLEREDRAVLDALCRKASVALDDGAVGAQQAVAEAGGVGLEHAQLAREVRDDLGDRDRPGDAEVGAPGPRRHGQPDERRGRALAHECSSPKVHDFWFLRRSAETDPSIDGEFSPLATGNAPRMVIPVRTSGDRPRPGSNHHEWSGRTTARSLGTRREGK